jgi:hypothetical protein
MIDLCLVIIGADDLGSHLAFDRGLRRPFE